MDWHPTVDARRCAKCGICVNCGKAVFESTTAGPMVVRPNDCVVVCSTCSNLCQAKCITFPPVDELRQIDQKHGIRNEVKEVLEAEGKIVQQDRRPACP
jgi:NAD-dependent dihydropyrimidine dehydrogenase PreA subunit